jgi:hypothetical protein
MGALFTKRLFMVPYLQNAYLWCLIYKTLIHGALFTKRLFIDFFNEYPNTSSRQATARPPSPRTAAGTTTKNDIQYKIKHVTTL